MVDQGPELLRLHGLREVLLSETSYNAGNGRLPFDLGAFDLDGTVLRRDLTITEATVDAVRALRERGVRLVVATGRRFEGTREHAERLGFEDESPVICSSGSMVRRSTGETHLQRTRTGSARGEVMEWAEH